MKNLLGQVLWQEYDTLGDVYEARLKRNYYPLFFTAKGRIEGKTLVTSLMFDNVLSVATQNSVYALCEKMSQGFINYEAGIRIGVAGEYVLQDGAVKSVKNISSLVIRVPHQVENCSLSLPKSALSKNILIFAPPFSGKTTFLRDLARRSDKSQYKTVIIDERSEIAASGQMETGRADVIEGLPKTKAYQNAIRSLSPEILVTDEVFGENEYAAIAEIIRTGVKVYATMHCKDLNSIPPQMKIFDVYVKLCSSPMGRVEEVFYA